MFTANYLHLFQVWEFAHHSCFFSIQGEQWSWEVFQKLKKKIEIVSGRKRKKKFIVPIEWLCFEYLIWNIVIQIEAFVFRSLGSHSFWHYASLHSLRSCDVSHLTMKIVLHSTLSCLFSIRCTASLSAVKCNTISSHGWNRWHEEKNIDSYLCKYVSKCGAFDKHRTELK